MALCLAGATFASASPENLRFEGLSLNEGLSQTNVLTIYQDLNGFLWFGTEDGLNRYDGYSFDVYMHDPEDPRSLASSWIWAVAEDNQGSLWVGTRNSGLNRFESGNGGFFQRFRHNPDQKNSISGNDVRVIRPNKDGTLWLGTDGGLDLFDPVRGVILTYRHDPDNLNSLGDSTVLCALVASDGAIWIGTREGGLNRLNPKTGDVIRFNSESPEGRRIPAAEILALSEAADGTILVGSALEGLFRLNPSSEEVEEIILDELGDAQRIHSILGDEDGNLWIGTKAGLYVRWSGRRDFLRFSHDDNDTTTLSDDEINYLFRDEGGVLWIGTKAAGLSKWNPQTGFFASFGSKTPGSTMTRDLVVAFTESESGEIWVGTFGGLHQFDRRSAKWTSYAHDPSDPTLPSSNRVTALHEDRLGDLWVGTYDAGLSRRKKGETGFVQYMPGNEEGSLSHSGIMSIYEDPQGELWFGTFGKGIDRFVRDEDRFESLDLGMEVDGVGITTMLRDRGRLWIGTDTKGLYGYEFSSGETSHIVQDPEVENSLSSDTITVMFVDENDDMWIGSQIGLNLWRSKDRQGLVENFQHLTTRHGLPNNFVYGLLPDDRGNLWLSTNSGLSRFDPRETRFTNYDESHGLQSLEFNFGAFLKSRRGEMLFGGVEGFNLFDPNVIGQNPHLPPVKLTSFKKLNVEVPLDVPVWDLDEVEVSWRDYSLSFEFSALDYTQPGLNSYAYRLDGFDNDWNYIEHERRAIYTNLDAGQYVFRVKAANNDGLWNEEGLAVKVKVVPPPWRSWWAYLLYALGLGGGVFAYVRAQTRKLRREKDYNRKLELEVAERTQELQEAALSDPLTGLRNRRYLMTKISEDLEALRAQYESNGEQRRTSRDEEYDVLFLMIDLDGLKTINDVHGHKAGDAAILQMRDVLKGTCRQTDTLIRWGGDEFLVVSRNLSRRAAEIMSERIRKAVDEHDTRMEDGTQLELSCSIGFAFFPFFPTKPALIHPEQVVTIADRALYISKESGRNAWVGLVANQKAANDNLDEDVMERVGDTLSPLIDEEIMELTASLPAETLVLDR